MQPPTVLSKYSSVLLAVPALGMIFLAIINFGMTEHQNAMEDFEEALLDLSDRAIEEITGKVDEKMEDNTNRFVSRVVKLLKTELPKVGSARHTIPENQKWACKSQAGQDVYMYENFFWKKDGPGVFVEFGARDGVEHSNTFFYEHVLGWSGVLVEPVEFEALKQNRPGSLCLQGAVCPHAGKARFGVSSIAGWHGLTKQYPKNRLEQMDKTVLVQCFTLNEVLRASGFRKIDYMTIDTEGSEVDVVESFDFQRYVVDFVQVEMLVGEDEKKEKLQRLMLANGYELVVDFVVAPDTWDCIYKRTSKADLTRFNGILSHGWPPLMTSKEVKRPLVGPPASDFV